MSDPSTTLVILGASGDLTRRLLLPGLGTLLEADPQRRVAVWGVGRDELTEQQWHDRLHGALGAGGCPAAQAEAICDGSRYVRADVTDADDLGGLLDALREAGDPKLAATVLYFALPPSVTAQVCRQLAGRDLGGLRLGLEKPFGHDLHSARSLNALLAGLRDEDCIFRVDHFLGYAQVQNILGLRFANRVLEPLWSATHIESVDIIADETLALEGRAGYYDKAGALVDMLQSHLLLMLSLVVMEEPARLDAREVRDMMVHALRVTHVADDDPVTGSRRARYTAGSIGEREVPSYVDEPGVDPAHDTETLAELDLQVDNRRWAGVPFRLRSGKALGAAVRRILVRFRPVDYRPRGLGGDAAPANTLIVDLNPDTLRLSLATIDPDDRRQLVTSTMDVHLGRSEIRPYGEILAGMLDGDPFLSVRGDVAEQCWRICEPVLHAWDADRVPLQEYAAGSAGPQGWPLVPGRSSPATN